MPKYQVYYAQNATFHPSGEHGTALLTVDTLQTTHVFVRDVEAKCLDDVYCRMQGETWSPNGEARSLLKCLDLSHTSMSVGDVVQDQEGIFWECLDDGWRPIVGE